MIGDPVEIVYDYPLWVLTYGQRCLCTRADGEEILLVWTDQAAAEEFRDRHSAAWDYRPIRFETPLEWAEFLVMQAEANIDAAMVDPTSMPMRVWRRVDLFDWIQSTLEMKGQS